MKQSSVFYLTTVENILIKWVITIGTLYATVNVHLNVMNFIHHVIITAIKYCTFKKRKESKVFNTGFKTVLSLTARSYNMVGHLKFGLVLLGGYFIFHDPLNPLQMVGIFTTLSGESCVWGHAVIYLAKSS